MMPQPKVDKSNIVGLTLANLPVSFLCPFKGSLHVKFRDGFYFCLGCSLLLQFNNFVFRLRDKV